MTKCIFRFEYGVGNPFKGRFLFWNTYQNFEVISIQQLKEKKPLVLLFFQLFLFQQQGVQDGSQIGMDDQDAAQVVRQAVTMDMNAGLRAESPVTSIVESTHREAVRRASESVGCKNFVKFGQWVSHKLCLYCSNFAHRLLLEEVVG